MGKADKLSPAPVATGKIEPRTLLIGAVFWLAATWAHNLFGNYGAGIYRWL
jgi:hypothetical protein